MSSHVGLVEVRVRRGALGVLASSFTVAWLMMVWLVHIFVPSDLGGLSRLMRPLLPYVAVAILINIWRFYRASIIGRIVIDDRGVYLPWFWWESHRLTLWSKVARAAVDSVAGSGVRAQRLRLFGHRGSVSAVVGRRWVEDWDLLLQAIRERDVEIRVMPAMSAWDAAAADGLVKPRPRWLLRRRK
jgi:hypothetical protein